MAVICLRAGYSAEEATLIEFCRARIASYKKPKHVIFVDVLPRNASGKVLKRETQRSDRRQRMDSRRRLKRPPSPDRARRWRY